MTNAEGPRLLRRLPAVGRWLADPGLGPLVRRHGRRLVADAARLAIEAARQEARATGVVPPETEIRGRLERELDRLTVPTFTRVLNGTGVVLHTNLGRARLSDAARAAVAEAAGSIDLEYDLARGERGARDARVGELAAELTGAEAATAVNNCAGATLLMLAAVGRGREVVVARGELVEIGGGFRVPDIMAESGARLVEVGTTNKVYPEDYRRAVGPETGALLVVHRSNFAVVGFEHTPSAADMGRLAADCGVPLLVDLGSGLLADDDALGRAAPLVGREPRPADWVRAGADLVAFSGDKLLGGPQAGVLVGRTEWIERCRRHPLARALRLDKLGFAALDATLRAYRAGRAEELPTIAALAAPIEAVAARAEQLRAAIAPWFEGDEAAVIRPCSSRPGGGSLPLVELPSRAVVFGPRGQEGARLATRLRAGRPAIVGRTLEDRLALDARTLEDIEIPWVARGIRDAMNDRAQTKTGAEG